MTPDKILKNYSRDFQDGRSYSVEDTLQIVNDAYILGRNDALDWAAKNAKVWHNDITESIEVSESSILSGKNHPDLSTTLLP